MADEERTREMAHARPRSRLDAHIVTLGLAATRARARGLVLRGLVTVNGAIATRPAQPVSARDRVALAADEASYVSFGAAKLVAALEAFDDRCPVEGRVALDLGASTGGFTDVLLRRGAARVYAVDVGQGQLHPRLAANPRVIALERTDARALTRRIIPEPPGAIVADLSFISLAKALGPALALADQGAWLIALVKPQFEVGPGFVGKGGIVRDAGARGAALTAIREWLGAMPGWRVIGALTAPGLKGKANEEYLIGAARDG